MINPYATSLFIAARLDRSLHTMPDSETRLDRKRPRWAAPRHWRLRAAQ